MTIRPHAAPIAGAFLISLFFATTALAANTCCPCSCPPKAAPHAKTRLAPAHDMHHFQSADAEDTHIAVASADVEYAQSYYDYSSSSTVSEGMATNGWVEAPNDGQVGCLNACDTGYGSRRVENLSGYFDGGVGAGAEGFTDGFGDTHFAVGSFARDSHNGYGMRFQNGYAPNGYAPNGYAPNGFVPNGYVSGRFAPREGAQPRDPRGGRGPGVRFGIQAGFGNY